jgi:hypothetical protein
MTSRVTMNFEFESPDHQHLVPLSARRLVLIGVTGAHIAATAGHPCLGAAGV